MLPLWPGKWPQTAPVTISGKTLTNWLLKPLLTTFPSSSVLIFPGPPIKTFGGDALGSSPSDTPVACGGVLHSAHRVEALFAKADAMKKSGSLKVVYKRVIEEVFWIGILGLGKFFRIQVA